MRLAVFYHCLLFMGQPPELLDKALVVVTEQMAQLKSSGLESAAEEIHIGINGGEESELFRELFPAKAQITHHGLKSKSENLTCVMMENWVKTHLGWAVLYFHAKSATYKIGDARGTMGDNWRHRMMWHCVDNWQQCVNDLDQFEAVGCHWTCFQKGQFHKGAWCPCRNEARDYQSQHYFAGTFFWVRSEFWATIPSLYTRQRIKDSGIDSLESRFEAEVIIGTGPRLPRVNSYHDGQIGT